jgi:rfaE bifunctional protein kinase chain/domain
VNLIQEKRFKEITSEFSKLKPIIIVGDVGIDKYTLGDVTRISPEAPVPVVHVQREWEKLGLAANIGHNLQSLGIEGTLCGVVGNDIRAPRFDSLLEAENLKTWGIVRDPSRPTIFKERITTGTQQICRIDYEDDLPISSEVESTLIERVGDFLDDHSGVILEDYAKGTMTKEVIRKCIEMAREKEKLVFVDPGVSTPPEYYKGCYLLKPNLKEARLMVESLGYTYKKKTLEEKAVILADKLDVEKLVITLGPEGMALLDTAGEGKLEVIPTVAQEVFDVSGAGDTTISLLASALLCGATLNEAAWIGNCGAGVVVAKKGTATVNQEELFTFYHRVLERYQ